ncbi:hypothetical protein [Mariniluteicoccus flavus]
MVVAAGAALLGWTAAAHAEEPLPEQVRQAVVRDLGVTPEAYAARGERAAIAGRLSDQLAGLPGFRNVSLDGDRVVVWGSGEPVAQAARAAGAELRAPSTTVDVPTLLRAFGEQVGADRLVGCEIAADGVVTLTVAGDPAKAGPRGAAPGDFARRHGASVVSRELMTPQAGPVRAGEGFVAHNDPAGGARCTTGLAVLAPDGSQRMVSAGHCTLDGRLNRAYALPHETISLGTLEMAQFGGPGNAANTAGDGTDLSLWKGMATDLLPEVATFTGSPLKVTGSVRPVVGAQVCVAGATTQEWRCATVTSVGGTYVQGGDQRRWVNGFGFGLQAMVGDSGAPVMAGSRAMGILTASGTSAGSAYASDLGPLEQRGFRVEVTPNAVPEGPIRQEWLRLGGETGTLGPAAGEQFCGLRDGGCWQQFAGGKIHWSPATGAHFSRGSVQDRWASLDWERGFLGYPTTDENCGLRDGGCWQGFEGGGKIHWSPATGAQFSRGLVQDRWRDLGWENGRLGYPQTGEMCGLVGGGCWQRFTDSRVYFSPATGAHPVWGAIGDHWDSSGYEHGRLGSPLGAETCSASGCEQRFQRGVITWSPTAGARG